MRMMRGTRLRLALVMSALAAFAVTRPAAAEPVPVPAPLLRGVPALPGPLAAPSKPAAGGLRLLAAKPDWGRVGTPFTLTGDGLPPNRELDLVWATSDARYLLEALPENVKYHGRQFTAVNVVLAKTRTDAAGRLEVKLKAPRDFGAVHDIYAVVDGIQVAKGGFQVVRSVSVSPREGPVGTPITITMTGLGAHPYLSTSAVLYDNKYAGFISATNTRGMAKVQIRAAGPAGVRAIEIAPASAAVPYLDIEQSAVAFVGKFRTTFRVTRDAGPPPDRVEWPENVQPTGAGRTAIRGQRADGVTARLGVARGSILSRVPVEASGLTPNAPVALQWVTAVGTRATAAGWSLTAVPLASAVADSRGALDAEVQIPDNLGGWNAVQLLQAGKVVAELPYFVERSLVEITPKKVRAGEVFQIHLKGIGWTELDNTVAITYDNGYIGYACGFYSRGDITMNMVATGEPGTHLIDLYPTIYKGVAKDTWLEQVPILSFRQDAPGLALGYRLPAIRLAIEVTR